MTDQPEDSTGRDTLRDDAWLRERVRLLCRRHFRDLPGGKPIVAGFGRVARRRFGSIRPDGDFCRITVNGLFRRPELPDFVVDATVAHELAHYIHGFGSGLPKQHARPHSGGVVGRELARRGLAELEARGDEWRAANWAAFYDAFAPGCTARRSAVLDHREALWSAYLATPRFRTEADLRCLAEEVACRFALTDLPFAIAWHMGSLRQHGLSYYRPAGNRVMVSGLLADPRVPACVITAQIAYWLRRRLPSRVRHGVWAAARPAIEREIEAGERWAEKSWSRHWQRNHPLTASR